MLTTNLIATNLIATTSADPFTRGLDYLYAVRSLALDLEMVDLVYDLEHRVSACTWIGAHIPAVSAQLHTYLEVCHQCFHAWEQPPVQVFAAPLAQSFGLDAFCNFATNPITILIDVGRMMPRDWLLVMVHEYAHAHAGSPGHHEQYARSLTHLCRGLEIPLPPWKPGREEELRFYPSYPGIPDPLAFWQGKNDDWRSQVTNSYFPSPSIG